MEKRTHFNGVQTHKTSMIVGLESVRGTKNSGAQICCDNGGGKAEILGPLFKTMANDKKKFDDYILGIKREFEKKKKSRQLTLFDSIPQKRKSKEIQSPNVRKSKSVFTQWTI